jgi:glycerophosphoryl diester phosphodiesterase
MRNQPFLFDASAAGALALALLAGPGAGAAAAGEGTSVQLGPRPFYLVEDMEPSSLKQTLQACADGPFLTSDFSIGHRGACQQFPEHTKESYQAAARMGAGIIECDVTFTKDLQLVCRHAQCDLHTTTNILISPLGAKCSEPFVPYDPQTGEPASAKCCTSDLTLAEFKSLKGKMDAFDPLALTPEEFIDATPSWRTDLYSAPYDGEQWGGTLLTHAESIELFQSLGRKMTPELKAPEVPMPFGDYTQERYAQQLIDEYKAAGVPASDVFPQSFSLPDVLYWIEHEPAFGKQAVYLDDANVPGDLPSLADLQSYKAQGVNIVGPPLFALLALDGAGRIVPSDYARNTRRAGLDVITWTLERSGLLKDGGGFYYQTLAPVINNDGDAYEALDVVARDVGVLGIFSDWPATVTYYANCMAGRCLNCRLRD